MNKYEINFARAGGKSKERIVQRGKFEIMNSGPIGH